MAITVESLTETYHKYKSKFYGQKEDYFAPLFIAEKFDRRVETILPNCVFGKNNDEGIDAYFIDKDARNLYLYR